MIRRLRSDVLILTVSQWVLVVRFLGISEIFVLVFTFVL